MTGQRFLTGLIGRGILESRSPLLHEREADAQGLRLVYSLFDFADLGLSESDLPRMLAALELAGFAGVNVTYPYKQVVVSELDALSSEAERIGAVNTVQLRGGRRIGYNTDVTGFAAAFRQTLEGVGLDRVVQIGAGGAGSATAYALLDLGVKQLTVHDRDPQRALALIGQLSAHFDARRLMLCTDLSHTLATTDGIVNATPMGMTTHPGMPIPEDVLRSDHWVADIVYFPLETALLGAARRRGCRVMDGGGMAVWQAVGAFEVFTDCPADAERMTETFRKGPPGVSGGDG
jgi:quinate/shikimate dehydrogenase (NAD+)